MQFKTLDELQAEMAESGGNDPLLNSLRDGQVDGILGRAPIRARSSMPTEPEPGTWDVVGDALLAAPRGALETLDGFYDLVDAVSFDLFPDLNLNFLGESKYLPGQLIQLASEFGTSLYGGMAGARLLGKIGKIGDLYDRSTSARFAVAGMFMDAAMTDDAQTTLLGALVHQYPELENPLIEALESADEDSKVYSKLYGALEGLGVGAAIGSIWSGVKLLRSAGRNVSVDEIPTILEKARKESGIPTDPELKEMAMPLDEADGLLESKGLLADDIAEHVKSFEDEADEAADAISDSMRSEPSRELAEDYIEEQKRLERWAKEKDKEGLPLSHKGSNPMKMTPTERNILGLKDQTRNLVHVSSTEDAALTAHAIEQAIINKTADYPRVKLNTMLRKAAEMRSMMTGRSVKSVLVELGEYTDDVRNGFGHLGAVNKVVDDTMRDVGDGYKALNQAIQQGLEPDRVSYLEMRLAEKVEIAGGLQTGRKQVGTAWSELGRAQRIGVGGGRKFTVARGEVVPYNPEVDDWAKLVEKSGSEEAMAAGREYGKKRGASKEMVKKAKRMAALADRGDTASRARMLEMELDGAWDVIKRKGITWWIHGLLQRPTTHMVNISTSSANALVLPLERALGGIGRGIAGMGFDEAKAGLHQFQATIRNMAAMSNVRAGWDAAVEGAPQLLPESGMIDYAAMADDMASVGTMGRMGRTVATMWQLGSRVMVGQDELIKRATFLGRLEADLAQKAARELPGNVQAQSEYVAQWMRRSINGKNIMTEEGAFDIARKAVDKQKAREASRLGWSQYDDPKALNEAYAREFDTIWSEDFDRLLVNAANEARDATFTRSPQYGTIGKSVQDAINAHPLLRIWMPFVRTPVNIVQQVANHLNPAGPVAYGMHKSFGIDLLGMQKTTNRFMQDIAGPAATGASKAQAVGRLVTGWGAMFTGLHLASTGEITGRGPSDPEQRQTLLDAGWLPYSFRTEDGQFIQFQRFAPFSSYLGLAADYHDYLRMAEPEENGSAGVVLYGGMTAIANNMTSQTYMQGLKNLLDVMTAPDKNAGRVMRQLAGSVIPSGVSQFATAKDDDLHEVRTVLDAMMNRVPGLSNNLPVKRNVLGEPIKRTQALGTDTIGSVMNIWMPVSYSETTEDPITREMSELEHGFQPPRMTKGGINLLDYRGASGQTAYDRWQQLQGEVRVGGRSIRQDLGRLISSPAYQSQTKESLPMQDSPRIGLIRNVISRFRREAWKQTLKEFPELRSTYAQAKQRARNPYAIAR